jgi:hypothetical protein
MKRLVVFLLFALPAPATTENLTLPCYRDGQPAKFTGRTRGEGYECEFSHVWQGRTHRVVFPCAAARRFNGKDVTKPYSSPFGPLTMVGPSIP